MAPMLSPNDPPWRMSNLGCQQQSGRSVQQEKDNDKQSSLSADQTLTSADPIRIRPDSTGRTDELMLYAMPTHSRFASPNEPNPGFHDQT